jgi:hypothetical protein
MNKTISFVSYFGYFVIQNSMFKHPVSMSFWALLGLVMIF